MDTQILDIAHISFLELIRAMIQQTGPANTKGALIRLAVQTGDKVPMVDFQSMEAFVETFREGTNPIIQVEGRAKYEGNGLFGLPVCPFAASISAYGSILGKLPDNYAQVVEEYNKDTATTEALKVGSGSGVSPFCSVHQPMRSKVAGKITIGGKPIEVLQLGCKSGKGVKAIAERWIAEGGWTRDEVERILDSNMCCYGIKTGS